MTQRYDAIIIGAGQGGDPLARALGDVKGGPAFTHISYDDFRILQANLLHGGHRTIGDRPVPYTALRDGVFAHPTLAESLNNLFMTLG